MVQDVTCLNKHIPMEIPPLCCMPAQAQTQSLQCSLIFLVKLISVHSADSENIITWEIH